MPSGIILQSAVKVVFFCLICFLSIVHFVQAISVARDVYGLVKVVGGRAKRRTRPALWTGGTG